jgi:teichoic acid transport system permease protein
MLKILKEHQGFGKIILKLAKSDLIKTYRGSALGWSWAIIKPSVVIAVYWFTFTIGLRAPSIINGYPYFLWLIAGIVPWFFMSEMIGQGTTSLRKYSYLITKMNFPVSTIPTFVGLSKMLVHLALLLVVIFLFVTFGYPIDIYYLQIPFYILMMYLMFTSWILLAAPLAVLSKDFANLVSSFITPLFWFSGVIWDPSNVTSFWASAMLKVNPITYLSSGYRDIFIDKVWFFEKKETLAFLIVLTIMFASASYIYNRLRKDIPDIL